MPKNQSKKDTSAFTEATYQLRQKQYQETVDLQVNYNTEFSKIAESTIDLIQRLIKPINENQEMRFKELQKLYVEQRGHLNQKHRKELRELKEKYTHE